MHTRTTISAQRHASVWVPRAQAGGSTQRFTHEGRVVGRPTQHLGSIEQCLGSPEGRFFGVGFKRVAHSLTRLEISARPGLGAVTARAALSYPEDWSRKAAGAPPPHLSSVDAVALMVELVDAYLADTFRLDPAQRGRSELRSYQMRVRSPQEELRSFAVQAVCVSSCEPTAGLAGRSASMFECAIGTVRAVCTIEHETTEHRVASRWYATSSDILGERPRPFSDGYKRRGHRIEDLLLANDLRAIQATVTVDRPSGEHDDVVGFGSSLETYTSPIDCLVVLAQLGQVLAYRLDAIERTSSNTLWMRRLSMQTPTSHQPIDTDLPADVGVTRSGLLSIGPRRWRTLDFSGHLMGVRIEAALAHQLPDDGEAEGGRRDATPVPALGTGMAR